MAGTRGIGQPDREIYNLLAALNQEQRREKHDINGLYEGRLRSHAQNFEGVKRKWEDFTGVPIPVKKLKTLEPLGPIVKEDGNSNKLNAAELNQKPAAKRGAKEEKGKPPHPDDKIDVDSMIVNDLRKELKKRQLGTTGRKAELQARLKRFLAEAKQKREAQWVVKHAKAKDTGLQTKQVRIGDELKKGLTHKQHEVEEIDVFIEKASENEGDISLVHAKGISGSSGKLKGSLMETETLAKEAAKPLTAPAKLSVADNLLSSMKKKAPKSALKPSKYTSSNMRSTPQLDNATTSSNKKPCQSIREGSPAPTQHIPIKISESSSESSTNSSINSSSSSKSAKQQVNAGKMKIKPTLTQTNSVGSAFKTKARGAGTAKMMEKKKAHAAASEARKARLAEMRQKAKPTTAKASSATKHTHSHSKYAVSSSSTKMASTSTLGESKSVSRLAKMREKAAAEKNTETTAPMKPTADAGTRHASIISSSSSTTSVTSSSTNPKGCSTKRDSHVMASQPSVLKSILDPSNKPSPVPEVKTLAKLNVKPLSPMQTYEMSDREVESDSESESDEEYERQKPRKAIPEWAQKANLHRALDRQFSESLDRLDPDKIFGEVLTCNLEDIFDKKKSRYQRRTSSGNWAKDHVTLAEKLTYKRTMGYGN